MTLRSPFTRLLLVGSLTAAGLVTTAAPAAPAAADFHLIQVQEVSAGTSAAPNADFVELQMTFSGQGNVSGHELLLFDAAGSRMDCTLPADVAGEDIGDRILLGTTEFQATDAEDPDFTVPPLLHADGGAVCWENIDCVSWGTFSGTTTSPAGTPEAGGIPPGTSIDRIADTQNSDADFVDQMTPMAQANGSSTLGSTTCQPGGGGPGGGAFDLSNLKTKVKGGRATIRGKVNPPAPGERVKLTFFANGSPLRKLAAKSATLNAESRFKKRFKVPSDSTRCRVVVRFMGSKLGQKKFRC